MTPFERSILATPEAISALTDDLTAYLHEHGVDARAVHHVGLVLDEVLTNLGTHGNFRTKPAHVRVEIEAGQVTGEIVDSGPPFDPRQAPEPSLDLDATDRPVGGLGLHLVRKLSSTLEYARKGGENWMKFAIARGGQ